MTLMTNKGVRQLLRLQLAAILIFLVFKLSRRQLIGLASSDSVEVFLWSFPNLVEGIVGILTVTALLLVISQHFPALQKWLPPQGVYVLSGAISSAYVLMQELNGFRFIGGENTADMNDVYFSIIGLCIGAGLIWLTKPHRYGQA